MEPKKDDPGAIPEPSDRRIEFEALFIKLSVKQGSVQLADRVRSFEGEKRLLQRKNEEKCISRFEEFLSKHHIEIKRCKKMNII